MLYLTDVACKMSQSRETLYSYLSIRVPDQSHVASAAQLEIINQIVNKQRFSECAFSINIVFPCYLLTRSFTYPLTAWNESLSHSLLFTCFLRCICYMLCPNIPNIYLPYYLLLIIVVVLFLFSTTQINYKVDMKSELDLRLETKNISKYYMAALWRRAKCCCYN